MINSQEIGDNQVGRGAKADNLRPAVMNLSAKRENPFQDI